MRLDVRHLEVLIAIDEAGSISGAARRLGVDQPHVTRQLRRIESRLGTDVFVRTPRGVTTTAAGMQALSLARRALGVLDDLALVGADVPEGDSRQILRILYHGVPAISVLDDLMQEFPDLQVRFGSATPQVAMAQLAVGESDVFLGIWLPHVEWPNFGSLTGIQLVADPTFVYVAAEHPLAERSAIKLTDFANEGWIVGSDRDSWTMVSEECRLIGGFSPRMLHSVEDEAGISALLARGQGVALGSSLAARRIGVVGRPYPGASPARWMQVYAPGRIDRDVTSSLADMLRARYSSWSSAHRDATRHPTA
jgi:DNA-binding transcriptional LysR family regulator